MIADLKPYPEYKDSGLPWLGQVPGHWYVRRIKAILREVDRRSTTGSEPLLSLRMQSGLVDHHALGGKRIPRSALVGYKRVLPGEIVMNRMRAAAGLFAAARSDGLVSPDYAIFRPACEMSVAYAVQLFRTPAMTSVFRLESRGLGTGESGFLRLYSDRFGMLPVPFPPPDEQEGIVRFLDWASGRLERAIRAKRKELALVSEMLSVVTENGLQLDGTRRVRLSVVAEVMSRPIDRRADHSYTRIGLYNRGRGIFHKATADGAELGDSDFFWVKEGDFVISGQFAWEGAVALARAKDSGCVASHRYPILRGREEYASSAVLFSLFRTSYGSMLLDHHSRGAAGRNRPLNAERLLKETVPIPPISAQAHITELLDKEYAVTQSLAQTVQCINAYRTRLVADVVTGKLDVREAAARLPDDAPPDITEDDTALTDETEAADEEGAV